MSKGIRSNSFQNYVQSIRKAFLFTVIYKPLGYRTEIQMPIAKVQYRSYRTAWGKAGKPVFNTLETLTVQLGTAHEWLNGSIASKAFPSSKPSLQSHTHSTSCNSRLRLFFLRHGLLKCMDMLKFCIMNMDIITSFKRKNWNSILSPVYCVSAKCQVPVFCSDQRTSLTRGYFKRCCKTNSTESDSFCDSQLSRIINDNQSRHGVLLTCFKFCNLVR